MAFLPDPTDPNDLGLEGTRQSLEGPDPAWETVKSILRPAGALIESTGNVRDIAEGSLLGDPLRHFKLAPGAMEKTAWDDVKGALGLGPSSFEKSGSLGSDVSNAVLGPKTEGEGFGTAIGRPLLGFAADILTDPATILTTGVPFTGFKGAAGLARAAETGIGEVAAAEDLLKAQVPLKGAFAGGAEAIGEAAQKLPEWQRTVDEYERFHQLSHPLFTAGTLPGAVEAGQHAYKTYQEQGFTPESAGAIAEAGVAAIPMLGLPGDVLNHAQELHAKYTDPNYKPRNPHADILSRGLDSLIQKGVIHPDQVPDIIHASEGGTFQPEDVQELTPQMAAEPEAVENAKPVGPQNRPLPGAAAVQNPENFDYRVFQEVLDRAQKEQANEPNQGRKAALEFHIDKVKKIIEEKKNEAPLNTSELVRELQEGLAKFNTPNDKLAEQTAAERALADQGREYVPDWESKSVIQQRRQKGIQFAEANLSRLGWDDQSIAAMSDEHKLTLDEQGVSPQDVERALLDKKEPDPTKFKPPPGYQKFPTKPPKTSDKLSPIAERVLAAQDPDVPQAIHDLMQANGVKLYLGPNDPIPALGSGAFHTTYALGEATKGKLKGKEVIARIGTVKGPVYKGLDEFVGHGGTITTKGGTVIDLTERTYGKDELGVSPADAFQHRVALSLKLRKKLPPGIIIQDLIHNRGNARYVEHPQGTVRKLGKNWMPVVSDFGVANPLNKITRAEPTKSMPSAEQHEYYNNPPTPEKAAKMAEDIVKDPTPPGKPTFSPGWHEAIGRLSAEWEKAKAQGLEDVLVHAESDFAKKGITSFLGRKLDPENVPEQLARMQSMLQAPFEIGQIIGVKGNEVVFHRAYTSSKAKSFNSGHPKYQEGLRAVEKAVANGEIDGYFTSHNHAGDVAQPSQADIDSIARYSGKNPKGYKGELITNGDTWSHVTPKDSIKSRAQFGSVIPANAENFRANPIFGVVVDENVESVKGYQLPSGHWTISNKDVAKQAKYAFAAGHGMSFIGLKGDGAVAHIMGMPLEKFAEMKPAAVEKMLTAQAARNGVFSWAMVSNMDPNNILHNKIATMMQTLHQDKTLGAPTAGHMNVWQEDPTHTTGFKIENKENAQTTYRLLADAEGPAKQFEAREKANEFILNKLMEMGVKQKDRGEGSEGPILQGELAQGEVGPPDITQKPGQGGESGLNVKENLDNLPDQTVRSELAQSLQMNKDDVFDRTKPGPTAEEIQATHQELLTQMSTDELHDTMKFISTEKGMQILHERFNFYRNALDEAQAAKADYQQTLEGGDKATQDAAKAAWVEKDFIKQTAMKDFVNNKTTVGRLLSFLKDLKVQELDPTQTRLGAMFSALRERGVKKDVIDALMKTYENNPAEFAIEVEKALQPSLGRALLQLWKAGLLSGPPTRLANTGSNAMWRGMLDLTRNTITPALDAVRAKLSGTERERYFGEAQASTQAYMQQFPVALARWKADKGGFTFKDISTIEGGKADIKSEGAAQERFGKLPVVGGAIKGYANVMDMFFKGLNADDTFAKHMAAAQAIYRIAYREARKGGKSHAEAMRDYVPMAQELMDGLRNPGGGNYAKHAALLEGPIRSAFKSETFQAELGQWGKSTEAYLKKHPALQTIIPFYNTPVNILKETLRTIPGIGSLMEGGFLREGGGGRKAYDALLNKEGVKSALGKISGRDIDLLSQQIMGAGIAGMVGTMAQYGQITGGGPGDPRKEAELRKTGWQPYSFKVGDTYYSYARMEPIAGVLSIAADIMESVKNGKMNLHDEKGKKAVLQLMATVLKNMESKTFLAGFEGAVTALNDPERSFGRFARQMEASLVPNIVGKTAQAIDPQFRDTSQGWTAPLQAKIPFASEALKGQVTASGQPRLRTGNALQRLVNPATMTSEVKTPAAALSKEMVRVNYLPTIPKSFNTIGNKQIPLTEEEVGWLTDAKDEASKVAQRVIKDPSYQNLPDSEEDPAYRLGMNTKQDSLRRIYQRYRKPVQDRINMRVRQRALKEMA